MLQVLDRTYLLNIVEHTYYIAAVSILNEWFLLVCCNIRIVSWLRVLETVFRESEACICVGGGKAVVLDLLFETFYRPTSWW